VEEFLLVDFFSKPARSRTIAAFSASAKTSGVQLGTQKSLYSTMALSPNRNTIERAQRGSRSVRINRGTFVQKSFRNTLRIISFASLLIVALAAAAVSLEAHAVLKSSSPAAGSVVTGPDVPVSLTFNVRVDAARSRLELLLPDASTVPLSAGKQPSPDTLTSKLTGLQSGAYTIRWQVLAPDGHISRGEIPFTVKTL
jgi:copper resistance protein C